MTKTCLETNQNKHEEFNLQRIQKTQTITLVTLVGLTILISSTFLQDAKSIESHEDILPKSRYIIENLKGDSLGTNFYWEMIPGESLYVNIKNDAELPIEKIHIVKDAILSTEFYEIDDHKLGKAPKGTISKYYLGWQGALSDIGQETENPIPKSFDIRSVGNGAGDIIIILSNMIDGDGVTGITKSTVYENQILKSEITVFDASSLTDRELERVIRHEFGHALGLAHSSAPEDLMYPEVKTPYPYISDCNIYGIVSLYDGKTNEEVICEK
ncbi:MAG TPA: matrixin family metalloprotease [Nitrosopumilaceae archaeon]|nr:matrixin family metalloprotease [Nitrosopumilaceae archaeon]